MNSLMELISNPVVWKVIITYYIFSAIVGALPTPETGGNKFYQFVFRFAHILAGNISRAAVKFQVPGAEEAKP